MKHKKLLAGGGAILLVALALGSNAVAAGTGPTVSVRVEGLNRTLLPATKVTLHPGSVTRYGAPKGSCSDESLQGALDSATHHRWVGKWSTQFGPEYEITSILGETHSFTSKDYWEIFVNNVAATTGACELKAKPGEQILFAAVPSNGPMQTPLVLEAPMRARAREPMRVTVRTFTGHQFVVVPGALVSGGGFSAKTGGKGIATLFPSTRGSIIVSAEKAGHVRGETQVTVF